MNFLRFASSLALAALVSGTAAEAYTLSQAAHPAESPPGGYSGDVYVDSRGCAYVRANIGTATNWVPRLASDRKTVICGLTPTASVTRTSSAPPPPPPPPPPTATGVPAPTTSDRPATTTTRTTGAPATSNEIRTMSVTCPADGSTARVRIGGGTIGLRCAPGQTTAQSYIVRGADGGRTRLIARPAPAAAAAPVATTAPAVAPAVTSTGARRVGVGDVLSGGRVVIGGRAPTRSTGTGGGYGFGSGYGFTSDPGPADPVPGVGSRTTLPLTTGAVAPVSAAPRAATVPEGYRTAWDDGRLNPQRGPRSAYGDQQMASLLTADRVPMRAVNPVPAQGLLYQPPSGFFLSSKSPTTEVVTTSAPAPAATTSTGYRYVQVGMFNVSGNATRAAATLRGLGLPGRVARTASGKTVVVAGPYERVAELKAALATARGKFPDAFLRN